jgi:type I restriction enzyme, S subunit
MDYAKARKLVTFKTGKLDSNAAVEGGKFPFFTCAQKTYSIDSYAFNTECVLLAGNNAGGIFPLKYYNGKFNAYQRTYVIESKQEEQLSIKYFYFFLRPYLRAFEQQATGATTKFLTLKILNAIDVALPDSSIQKKIAAILSAYDDLIENNKRRIALLERMAEEIYCEWFVRFRFPGHGKVKFEKGVPEGWELTKLEKAFVFTGGGTPSKEISRYWEDGNINWFTPSDTTSAKGIFLKHSGSQCTEEGLSNSSARLFPPYSIMITSRATIGAIGINTTPACTNQAFITCIPNERYPLAFLYHWLKMAKPYFEVLSSGATFAELTKGTFKRINILTPSKNVILEFDRIVRPFFKEIETLLNENECLNNLRDLLLPKLISGKLSVEKLDIQFPPSTQDEGKGNSQETAHA